MAIISHLGGVGVLMIGKVRFPDVVYAITVFEINGRRFARGGLSGETTALFAAITDDGEEVSLALEDGDVIPIAVLEKRFGGFVEFVCPSLAFTR